MVQAEKLLEDMLDDGLTPNVITYTSLMVVLRRGGQHERAIKILDLMRSKVHTIRDRTRWRAREIDRNRGSGVGGWGLLSGVHSCSRS